MAENRCFVCGKLIGNGGEYGLCDECGRNAAAFEKTADRMERLLKGKQAGGIEDAFTRMQDQYTAILQSDANNAGAYWGRLLSRYGIEYIYDEQNQTYHPVFYRAEKAPLDQDADCVSALKFSSGEEHDSYANEAAHLTRIQKALLSAAAPEIGIYITSCSPEKDENGEENATLKNARMLYALLKEAGYSVFMANDVLQADETAREAAVYHALQKATLMLVVATEKKDFDYWMCHAECKRFIAYSKENSRCTLFVMCRNLMPSALPQEMQNMQYFNMNHFGFKDRFLTAVGEVMGVKARDVAGDHGFGISLPKAAVEEKPVRRDMAAVLRAAKEEAAEEAPARVPEYIPEDASSDIPAPAVQPEEASAPAPAPAVRFEEPSAPAVRFEEPSVPAPAPAARFEEPSAPAAVPSGRENFERLNNPVDAMFFCLEQGDFDTAEGYSNMLLQQDRFCSAAYVAKLMISRGVTRKADLAKGTISMADDINYAKAVRYAAENERQELLGYEHAINRRLMEEEQRTRGHVVIGGASADKHAAQTPDVKAHTAGAPAETPIQPLKRAAKPARAARPAQQSAVQEAAPVAAPASEAAPSADAAPEDHASAKTPKVLLGVAAALLVAGGALVFSGGNGNAKKLDMAQEYRAAGNYEQAIELLSQIDRKNDDIAGELALNRYLRACELQSAGDKAAAAAIFEDLGDMNDSAARAVQCRADLLFDQGDLEGAYRLYAGLTADYQTHAADYLQFVAQADALLENGDLDAARAAYAKVSFLPGADDRINECAYRAAEKQQAAGELDAAAAAFGQLDGYKDSAARKEACLYQAGQNKLIADDLVSAKAYFSLLPDHMQAKTMLIAIEAYDKANQQMANGDLLGAMNAFRQLGDFSQAASKAAQCGQTLYDAAAAAYDAGHVQSAYDSFLQLSGFSDAAERASAISGAYAAAQVMVDAEDLDGAIAAYQQLGDYADAQDRVVRCRYARAEKAVANADYETAAADYAALAAAGYDVQNELTLMTRSAADSAMALRDYAKALNYYKRLEQSDDVRAQISLLADEAFDAGDYETAADAYTMTGNTEKLNISRYAMADRQLSAGEYDAAKQMFLLLGDFSNSADRALECDYDKALALKDQGEYAAAEAILTSLGDYADSAEQIRACRYGMADAALTAGHYEQALEAFTALGEYADSVDKVQICLLNIADTAYAAGEWDKAEALYAQLTDEAVAAEKLTACRMAHARALRDSGDYNAAAEKIAGIDTADAVALRDECRYLNGSALLNSEQPGDAVAMFEGISDAALKEKAMCEAAAALSARGEWLRAAEVLSAQNGEQAAAQLKRLASSAAAQGKAPEAVMLYGLIGDEEADAALVGQAALTDDAAIRAVYDGSETLSYENVRETLQSNADHIHYLRAQNLLAKNDYQGALAMLETLPEGYEHSDEMLMECRYRVAAEKMAEGDYQGAYQLYSRITEYDDVEQIIAADPMLSALAEEDRVKGPYRKVGNVVTFGSYDQDGVPGAEALRWIVIGYDDEKAILMSESAVAALPYNNRNAAVTWEESSLRAWLNQEFYQAAFTDAEKNAVEAVSNPEEAYSGNAKAGNTTEDRVYLLSVSEARALPAENSVRLCPVTPVAAAQGVYAENGVTWWWLRGPGGDNKQAAKVSVSGNVDRNGSKVTTLCGVRPVICVRIDQIPEME